jgi:hypothetical protein
LSLDLLPMCCFKRSLGFLQTKAYKSKTKINFSNFFDISKREAFMYLQRKNQHCIFILCVVFCSKTETHYTLCTGGPTLGAKSGLPDEFSQNMFPITPPGNGNVGLGPREVSEFGFKVGENSPPPKKIAGETSAKTKNNFFGT